MVNQLHEFTNVFKFSRFNGVELNTKLSFHREQQADVSEAVPPIDVRSGQIRS